MHCNYSVIIRTLGKAGAKYQKLLDSISAQTIPPSEIIVVLPEGYAPPAEKTGQEKFIYGEKGMVRQRHTGIEAASGEFVLLCDDDIAFPPNFMEQCHKRLQEHCADVLIPSRPEDYEESQNGKTFLKTGLRMTYLLLTGQVFPALFQRKYRYAVSPTGGIIAQFSIDRHKTYLAQSGAGGCLLMKRTTAKAVRFLEEKWLDDAAYALPEDHVFLYKTYLSGSKILYTPDIAYEHLDAASSMEGSLQRARQAKWLYATARNYTLFWHRFLFLPSSSTLQKLFLSLCLTFRMANTATLLFLSCIPMPGRRTCLTSLLQGYRDAFLFIKTPSYQSLPKIDKHV